MSYYQCGLNIVVESDITISYLDIFISSLSLSILLPQSLPYQLLF